MLVIAQNIVPTSSSMRDTSSFFKNILLKLLCNDHLRLKVFIFVDPENRKPSCIYLFSYSIILLAVVRM